MTFKSYRIKAIKVLVDEDLLDSVTIGTPVTVSGIFDDKEIVGRIIGAESEWMPDPVQTRQRTDG